MKKVFTVDGKEYAVLEPTSVIRRESQTLHSKIFGKCLKDVDILTRAQLEESIKNRNAWDRAKIEEKDRVEKELFEKVKKLNSGGIRLSEAESLALEIADLRNKMRELVYEYNQYDSYTVEARADEAATDYLVCNCLVDNEKGEKVYKTMDEYIENKDSEIAIMAAMKMMEIEYGTIEEIYSKMPENTFLIEYGFMDEELNFINKDGKITDREGRLIDKDGRYINEEGKFVDKDGNLIAEKQPFLDDEDKPIEKLSNENQTEEKPATEEIKTE
jgi:hypothetical protein